MVARNAWPLPRATPSTPIPVTQKSISRTVPAEDSHFRLWNSAKITRSAPGKTTMVVITSLERSSCLVLADAIRRVPFIAGSSLPQLPPGELQEHVLQGSGHDLEAPQVHPPGGRPIQQGPHGGLRLGHLQPVDRGTRPAGPVPVGPDRGAGDPGQTGEIRCL